jgi:hypothetical protein
MLLRITLGLDVTPKTNITHGMMEKDEAFG